MTDAHLDPGRRHDVVLLFDVTDGNPNGDPDAQNQPRTDDETGHGLVTDVAIKRKIRDTVALLRGDDPGYGIFVEAGHALSTRWRSHDAAADPVAAVCAAYYDVRMFGQVLTGGKGSGSIGLRGPVQLGFARSLDPVLPTGHTITRVTQTRQEDIDKGERTEIGSKWTVPYGLYRQRLHYSALRATKTGVDSDDLALLWRSIMLMFEQDRAASRGVMELRGLYVFSHPDALGVAPAGAITDRVRHERRSEGPPRSHTDYRQDLRTDDLPGGVVFTALVDGWAD
ncbi:type I-C CRISPR-associated protein Cas7/Csd2 [Verrucosispora sp. TAA-831]|uniref:type I-C CRISPR-associated protein Cas7/Csd2 n=1 Tax=Verrucosispora sp. TAA-831 TaxID=3422227 RepID=UPI003D6E58A1